MNAVISTIPPSYSKRRMSSAVLGIALIIVGALSTAAAIGVMAVFGSAGRLDSGSHQVASSGAAVVTDVSQIQNTHGVGAITGWPTLEVTAAGGSRTPIFVGLARSSDIDGYLAGVAVDQVTDITLRPFDLSVTRTAGAAAAAPPTDQTFWVASALSDSVADLSWPIRDGNYRLVIMNADGSPAMFSHVRVQLALPNAFPLSLAALAVGVLFTCGGIVIVVAALRRPRGPVAP